MRPQTRGIGSSGILFYMLRFSWICEKTKGRKEPVNDTSKETFGLFFRQGNMD
jgi:hypothetical protein